MLKSNRTFGVEIEIDSPRVDMDNIYRKIRPTWYVTTDSSIIGDNPVEIVSEPLKGENGEQSVIQMCEYLQKIGAITSGVNSGMHVHVDGSGFFGNQSYKAANEPDGESTFVSFRTIKAVLDLDSAHRLTEGDYLEFSRRMEYNFTNRRQDWNYIEIIGNEILTSGIREDGHSCIFMVPRKALDIPEPAEVIIKAKESDSKKGGKYFVLENNNEVLSRLKNLLLFYVVFNPVLSGMVPNSRKERNSYCQRVSETYSVEEIMAVDSINEFQKLWYLAENDSEVRQCMRRHYDDSRYQDFNFHSLWNRHGTIEMRAHKSTIDHKLILHWIKLHQLIIDSVHDGKIVEEHILAGSKLKLEHMVEYMLDILEAEKTTKKYVKTLINHYNYLDLQV